MKTTNQGYVDPQQWRAGSSRGGTIESPGWRASPFADDVELCPGYGSGLDRLRDHADKWNEGDESVRRHMAPMPWSEALFRGLSHRPGAGPRGVALYDDEWAELRPIPPLQGPAGVAEFLQYAWTAQASTREQLSSGTAGQLAMLRTDAELTFPALFAVSATEVCHVDASPAAHLRLVSDAAAVVALRQRIKDHQPMTKQTRIWPDKPAMLAELLRQYKERMALPGAMAAICEEQMADLWRMKKNSVHSSLTEARKAVPGATAAASGLQVA